MSWWDYGYQITAMANRTILVDNNTWNNTHISRVGQAMASSEEKAYEIMRELDVNYVLVIFGGLTGYSSDGKYNLVRQLYQHFLISLLFPKRVSKTINFFTHKPKRIRQDQDRIQNPIMIQSLSYILVILIFIIFI